jgi:nucleoside-diphosphate-sugar epimerase
MLLVTGANGFIGAAVVAAAVKRGTSVRAAVRSAVKSAHADVEYTMIEGLSAGAVWTSALAGVDVVVHTAARVHVMRDSVADPLQEYRHTNVTGTVRLARQAVAAGVRRFVYLSSIKVNGERTSPGKPFRAIDTPAPVDPYGISKHEAEVALHEVAEETGLEVVIIRPVLVYGPGVKANFAAMMHWLQWAVPLPLGAIHNKRSLVGLDNLVDLILVCAAHTAAPGHTFLVSDDEDLSTTDLLRRMSIALGVSPPLFPVSESFLRFVTRIVGRQDLGRRLFESLQVDIEPTKRMLSWTPPVTVDEELRVTAEDILRHAKRGRFQ